MSGHDCLKLLNAVDHETSSRRAEMPLRETPLQPSKRICETRPAIIDDVINEYGEQVKFNLAPGGTFFGMSSEVRAKLLSVLNRPDECRDLSRYGDVLGTPDLRRLWANVLVNGYNEDNGVASIHTKPGEFSDTGLMALDEVRPMQELMITAGANQAFVNVILATCDEGDEVLLILPYYFSHFNALVMTGISPVCVPVDKNSLLPIISDIAERITPRSRAVVVVNPGNPSGIVFCKELMDNIAAICKSTGIGLIIDEAYREFVHVGESRLIYSPRDDDGIIRIFTASKAYGLAGWRIGAVQYPKSISDDMRKAQDTIPTHASRFGERVAYEALKHNPLHETNATPSNITLLNDVRKIFIKCLEPVYKDTPLADVFVIPNGAFYFFLPYMSSHGQDSVSQSDDMLAVKYLAIDHSVLVTPGFAFGMPGYLRVSYGCTEPSVAPAAAESLALGMRQLIHQHTSGPKPSGSG